MSSKLPKNVVLVSEYKKVSEYTVHHNLLSVWDSQGAKLSPIHCQKNPQCAHVVGWVHVRCLPGEHLDTLWEESKSVEAVLLFFL